MNTKIKIAAALTVLTGVVAFAGLVSYAGSTIALRERFPDIDPDVVESAHWEMVKKGLKGQLAHIDTNDEAVMDQLFLLEVDRLTSN